MVDVNRDHGNLLKEIVQNSSHGKKITNTSNHYIMQVIISR